MVSCYQFDKYDDKSITIQFVISKQLLKNIDKEMQYWRNSGT